MCSVLLTVTLYAGSLRHCTGEVYKMPSKVFKPIITSTYNCSQGSVQQMQEQKDLIYQTTISLILLITLCTSVKNILSRRTKFSKYRFKYSYRGGSRKC